MIRSSKLKDGALLVASVAFSLVLAEILIGWVAPLRDVGPSFTIHDAFLGKALKPNMDAVRRTPEFTMRITTNRHGFRGMKDDTLPSGAVVFLGDSFTMGYGVDDGQEFPVLVSRKLEQRHGANAPPVINMGMGDSGNGRWLKLLQAFGNSIGPRLVVMQILENDFQDTLNERLYDIGADGRLRELPVPPPGATHRLQQFIDWVPGLASTNFIALMRQVHASRQVSADDAARRITGSRQPGDELMMLLLEEVVSLCRQRGWPMLFVMIGVEGERRAALSALFDRLGVELISFPHKKDRPEHYYNVDGHWNPSGHIFAAERLTSEIERLLALPPAVRDQVRPNIRKLNGAR